MYLQSLSYIAAYRYPLTPATHVSSSHAVNEAARTTAANNSEALEALGASAGTATLLDELELSPEAIAILSAAPLARSGEREATAVQATNLSSQTGSFAADSETSGSLISDSFDTSESRVSQAQEPPPPTDGGSSPPAEDAGASASADAEETDDAATASVDELEPEEEEQVKKLAERDREVRTHEQAHIAAAGPHARGGPTYTYQKGPDGKRYAIGGEVQIDTSPVPNDPEATIRKAQIVRAAALAPAEPSSQDRSVAAAATKMQQQAQAELVLAKQDQTTTESNARQPDAESGNTVQVVTAQSATSRSNQRPPSQKLDVWL